MENFEFPEGSAKIRGNWQKFLYAVYEVFVFRNRHVCVGYLLGTNAKDIKTDAETSREYHQYTYF